MHRYRYMQVEYKAGASIEVIKYIPKGCRGSYRGERREKTVEEIAIANMRQAARKLARKINANFRPGDWHVVLTYKKDERPDRIQAQKNISKLLSDLRNVYKKHGFIFKYIQVTEYKRKSIHHHLIVNTVNDGQKTTVDYIRKAWKGKGNTKFVPLYENGEYRVLSEYLVKETEKTFREADSPVKQRYSCSRNLITPKPERRIRSVKKEWQQEPRPRPGYYIDRDTLYNGFDKLGYPYQRYVLVKIKPEPEDWMPDRARAAGEGGSSG